MLIKFYSMEGCHYCTKAKKLLSKEIDNNVVVEFSAKEAPKDVRGFPHFESPTTGKTHTGLPSSSHELFDVLGLKSENFDIDSKKGTSSTITTVCIVIIIVLLLLMLAMAYYCYSHSGNSSSKTNNFSYTSLNRTPYHHM